MSLRVVLIDPSPMFRYGVRQILESVPDCHLVGEAGDTDGLDAFLRRHKPHMLFMALPDEDAGGLAVIGQIRESHPQIRLLLNSGSTDAGAYGVRLMKLGVHGFLCRRQPVDDYRQAIATVVAGQRYISTALAQQMADTLYDPDHRPGHEGLSDREFQTMLMLASGLSVSDIAEKEGLSVKTVSEYRSRVLRKLGLRHTIELIQYAFRQRLVR